MSLGSGGGLTVNTDNSTIIVNGANALQVQLLPSGGLTYLSGGVEIFLDVSLNNTLLALTPTGLASPSTLAAGLFWQSGTGGTPGWQRIKAVEVPVEGADASISVDAVSNPNFVLFSAKYSSTGSTLLRTVGAFASTTGSGIDLVPQGSTLVFAGPTSGANAAPTFRALTSTDIPSLSSTNLPADIAYTDKANTFTQAQQIIVGSDPGSPGNGTIWYNSTSTVQGFRFQDSGVQGGGTFVVNQALSTGVVLNSTNAGSVKASTYTSIQFPANFFTAGRAMRIRYSVAMVIRTGTTINGGLYWVGSSTSTSLDGNFVSFAGPASESFLAEIYLVCQSTGVSGFFQVNGYYMDQQGLVFGGGIPIAPVLTSTTLDTTQAFWLAPFFNLNNVSSSNAHGTSFTIEVLDPP